MKYKELTLAELNEYSKKLAKESGSYCRNRVASDKAAKELGIGLGSISSVLVSDLEELAKYRKANYDKRLVEASLQVNILLRRKAEEGVVYPEQILREQASDNGIANMVVRMLIFLHYWNSKETNCHLGSDFPKECPNK